MNSNNTNSNGVSEQVILNNLYKLFGEKVFKEMQNRDESIPAEEFFNNLMADSLEFCVRISDSISRIEKESKPVDDVPMQSYAEPPAPVVVADEPQVDQGKKCPQCNVICDDDSVFCMTCGYRFSEPQPKPVIQPEPIVHPEPVPRFEPVFPQPPVNELKPMFCGNCGTKLDGDSVFCINCGCRVNG